MARPRKFTPKQFQKAWDDYFKWCDEHPWFRYEAIKSGDNAGKIIKIPTARPYTEISWCAFHNLGKHYLTQMSESLAAIEEDEEKELTAEEEQLSVILSRARARIWAQKFEGASVGAFKENIIAREMGLWDRMKNDLSTGEKPLEEINVNINFPNEIE